MPNLLPNFANPNYGMTNPASQEKLLSQLMGQSYQKAPPMLAPPSTAMQPRNRDPEREKAVQADKEKKSIQNAFDEIVETRNQTGKPFLPPVQRAQIFSKHGVPFQVVDRFNSAIDKMEAKAGYMGDPTQNVTRTLPDGSTSTTYESRQNIIENPIIKPISRKEVLLNRVLDDNIKPEDLKPMERRLLGIKLKDTPAPTMKKMGDVWYQWDTETQGWVDTGKKEEWTDTGKSAFQDVHSLLTSIGDVDADGSYTIPVDSDGHIPPAVREALAESGVNYNLSEITKTDKPWLFTGDNYSKKIVLGSYDPEKAEAYKAKKEYFIDSGFEQVSNKKGETAWINRKTGEILNFSTGKVTKAKQKPPPAGGNTVGNLLKSKAQKQVKKEKEPWPEFFEPGAPNKWLMKNLKKLPGYIKKQADMSGR